MYRFDGYQFTRKKWASPTLEKKHTIVDQMWSDHYGYIWITYSNGGIGCLNPFSEEYWLLPHGQDSTSSLINWRIKDLEQDQRGQYWLVGDRGVDIIRVFDFSAQKLEVEHLVHQPDDPFSITQGYNYDIAQSSDGSFWIGNRHGINHLNPTTRQFVNHQNNPGFPSDTCRSIAIDSKGTVYGLFSYEKTFYRYESSKDSFLPMPNIQFSGGNKFYGLIDSSNQMWIVETGFGLYRYDLEKQTSTFWPAYKENSLAVKGDYLGKPFLDREENLWLPGGFLLQKLARTHKEIQNRFFPYGDRTRIRGVWTDGKDLLVTSLEAGLVWADLETGDTLRWTSKNSPFLFNRISRVCPLGDRKFVISGRYAIYVLDLNRQAIKRVYQEDGVVFRNVITDHQGNVWVMGTKGVLGILDLEKGTLKKYHQEVKEQYPEINFWDLLPVNERQYWVASTQGGLFFMDLEKQSLKEIKISNAPGPQSYQKMRMWKDQFLLVTSPSGLYLVDTDHPNRILLLNQDWGLPSNLVLDVEPYGENELWITGTGGLSKVNMRDSTVRIYTQADGLASNFNGSIFQSTSGELFLCGENGLTIFDPNKMEDHPLPPRVNITECKVLNEAYSGAKPIESLDTIFLEYAENFLQIELSALHYMDPSRNQYAYRIGPGSSDWIQLGKNRNLTLSNLNPGTYTLELNAANADGVWMESPGMITLIVNPEFWQTWWFKLLIGSLLAGLIYLGIQFRLRQYRKENAFQRQIQELERQALQAQMNPHFLFNCLNSIKAYIGQSDIETAQRYLNEFAQLIRIVLYNSRQQTVRLQDEIEALRRYLNLEQFRFHPTFIYTIDIDPQIQTDFVEIPPMIFQPFVENAIWHGLMHKDSSDRKLRLSFSQKQKVIRVEIEDNGIGRALSKRIKTRSASKHQSLGMQITIDRLQQFPGWQGEQVKVNIIDLYDDDENPLGTRVLMDLPFQD